MTFDASKLGTHRQCFVMTVDGPHGWPDVPAMPATLHGPMTEDEANTAAVEMVEADPKRPAVYVLQSVRRVAGEVFVNVRNSYLFDRADTPSRPADPDPVEPAPRPASAEDDMPF
jgi:hypothetical protein